MNKKWMPILAGILEILAGFMMLASAVYVLGIYYVLIPHPWEDSSLAGWSMIQFIAALLQLSLLFVIGLFGIASLVGGVCALLRRRRGLAFAGAIATIPLYFIATLGVGAWANFMYDIPIHYFYWSPLLVSIAVITLIVLSKKEFE